MRRDLSRQDVLRSGAGALLGASLMPLAACASTQVGSPPAPMQTPIAPNLAPILDTYVAQNAAAAPLTTVAVYANGTALLRGYANGKPSSKVDLNWVFGIGSNTKVFTSTILAYQCVGSSPSKRLTDSVVPYLPADVAEHGTPEIKATTLVELATHTSSFPHSIKVQRNDTLFIDELPTKEQIEWWVTWKNDGTPNQNNECAGDPPGSCWQYSDWGFVTLGFAVAHSNQVAGSKYNELMARLVTGPLQMPHTGAQVALDVKGHLQDGSVVPHPPPDLKSNAPDMLTFLKASLGELPGVPDQLAQAIALTQAVHWKSPKLNMGLAWQRPHPKDGAPQVIWKNGAASGFTSFMGLVPSQKLAVVLLTNSDAATPTRAGLQILSALENSGA